MKQDETLRLFAPYVPGASNLSLTNNTKEIIQQLQKSDPSLSEAQLMGHLMKLFLDYSHAVLHADDDALRQLLTPDFYEAEHEQDLFENPDIQFAYLNGFEDGNLLLVLVVENGATKQRDILEKHYFLDFIQQAGSWRLDDLVKLDPSIGIDYE